MGIFPFAIIAGIILIILTTPSRAQRYTIADTATVKSLVSQAGDSSSSNPNKSIQLAQKAIDISLKIGFKRGCVQGMISKGNALSLLGKPEEARKLYVEALQMAEENAFKSQQIVANIFLASTYDDMGDFKKAIYHYDVALKAASTPPDSLMIVEIYIYMGTMMHNMHDYNKALEYLLKAENFATILNLPDDLSRIYNNIAGTYIAQKNYKEAFRYLKTVVTMNDSLGLGDPGPVIYMNMAICFDETGRRDSALFYYFKSLKQFEEAKDVRNEVRMLNGIGTVYYEMGRWNDAEKYYKLSLAMAKESSNLAVIAQNNYDLSTVYFEKGDYKKAFLYRDSSAITRDSLYNHEQIEALTELTTKYKTQEIEQKNTVLQKENDLQKMRIQRKNTLVYSMLGLAALFLIIGYLLVRQSTLRNQQQQMELEQKQLLAQINPHFIFNCLNSIQQFVVQNDTLNANRYLADFALLMRQTLDNSKDGIISVTREIDYINNYLSFEHMRFEDKFTYTVSCAAGIDPDTAEIPSMIIQPFVENAVRHGLCNLEDRKGVLEVSFYKEDGFLHCKIDDNGIGMDEAKRLKEQTFIKYKSLGMELTKQRLALVSKLHSEVYKISIINKTNQDHTAAGTTIIIKFPFQA